METRADRSQLTLDHEHECPHGLSSCVGDLTAVHTCIGHLGQSAHTVTVCTGVGSYGSPKTSRSQNLPEQGLPQYAGPAWEVKGRPDPLAFPKNLKKQEVKDGLQTPTAPPRPACSQAWQERPPHCGVGLSRREEPRMHFQRSSQHPANTVSV